MSEILNQSAQSLLTCPNITFFGCLELKVSRLSFHQWIQNYVIILNGNIYIYDNCNSKTPKMSEVLAVYDEIHVVQNRKKPPFWCFFLKPKFNNKPKIRFGAASEQEMKSIIEKFKHGILFSKNYSYPKDSPILNGITFQTEQTNLPLSQFTPSISSNPNRTQLPPPPPIDNLSNEFKNSPTPCFNSPVLPFGYPTQFPPNPINSFPTEFINLPHPTYNPNIGPQFPFYPVINNPDELRNFPNASCPLSPPLPNLNSYMDSPPPPYEIHRPLPNIPQNELSSRISSNDFIFKGTREDAVKELSKSHVIGSYLIRVENERNILTVQTKQGIVKYILTKNSMNNKISIQGNENQFNNQLELVVFYSLNNIPNYNCKLTIPYKLVSNQH